MMSPFTCLRAALALSFVLGVTGPAVAEVFEENFDDNAIDGEFLEIIGPEGFSVTFAGGKAVFDKAEGTGNGFINLITTFHVKGNFEVTVEAARTNATGIPVIGLASSHLPAGAGFTDVYFNGNGLVISNIFVDPVHTTVSLNDSATPVTFRIRRVGTRLIHECDPGSGFIHVSEADHLALAGPVAITLFLGQELGQTAAHSATFDDLMISGDAFTPPCGNGVLDGLEACDDDDPAWVPGEFCGQACTVLACGDPDDSKTLTASDALFVLRTSVGSSACDTCVCDVNRSGGATPVTATDALIVLQRGVGLPTDLACEACL